MFFLFSGGWVVDAKLSLTMINYSHMKTNTSASLGLGNKTEDFYGDDTHCLLWRAMFIQRMASLICYAWLMILRHPASNLSSIPTKVGLYHKHVDINIRSKKSKHLLKWVSAILYIRGWCVFVVDLGPVSLRLMTSQYKDIVTHTQKYMTVKCTFYGVWVQNFVWNFKGALWYFTQNFEPIHREICILWGGKNLTTYDILELLHL